MEIDFYTNNTFGAEFMNATFSSVIHIPCL